MADVISLGVIARVRAAVIVPALACLAVVWTRKDRVALSAMYLPLAVQVRRAAPSLRLGGISELR